MTKGSTTTVSVDRATLVKRSNTVVEIGNNWLKIASCRATGKGGIVNRIHCANLAELDDVSNDIDRAFTEFKLNRHDVITYIPRHLVTVRIIRVPSTDPNEITRMVHLQAGRQTPYSKEEVVSGYSVIDIDDEGYARILMVIARRNIISQRVETLKNAGVEIARIGLSSEGVCSAFQINRRKTNALKDAKTVAVVDVDSNFSEFLVVHEGRMVFTRHILIGTAQLSENRDRWFEQFTKEIGNSTELYRNEYQEHPINALALTGANEVLDSAAEKLGDNFDFPVLPIEVTEGFKANNDIISGITGDWKEISLSPLLGAGATPQKLAVDLAPPEFHLEARMLENRNQLSVLGVLTVFILFMISLMTIIGFYNRHSTIRVLDQSIAEVKPGAQHARQLKQHTDVIKNHLDSSTAPVVILSHLFEVTPDDIYLLDMGIENDNQVRIRARGGRQQSASEFVKRLDASPMFRDVKESFNNGKTEGGITFYEFELLCTSDSNQPNDDTKQKETP